MMGNERGAALIFAIMAMVIMTAIVVEFAYDTRVDVSMLANYRYTQQARYFSEAGVEAARVLLLSDLERDEANGILIDYYAHDASNAVGTNMADPSQSGGIALLGGDASLDEIWSLMTPEAPAVPLADTGGQVKLTIRDELGKVNLNQLDIPRGLDPASPVARAWVNFLVACGLDETTAQELVPKLVDWIDRDDDAMTHGAESAFYQQLDPAYMTRNGLFVSVDELRLLEGVSLETWAKLAPYVTVFPQENPLASRININTASAPVLQFLDPDIDAATAQAIIEERSRKPFAADSEFQQVLSAHSADSALYGRVIGKIRRDSNIFSVRSAAALHGVEYTVYAVLRRTRGKKEVETLYWRVE